MNWFGTQKGEGFEYHLLVIGIALALIEQGAGRFSVDAAIANQTGAEPKSGVTVTPCPYQANSPRNNRPDGSFCTAAG